MMGWLWGIAAVLVLWAGIAGLRRRAEYAHRRMQRPPQPRRPEPPGPAGGRPAQRGAQDDDDIDWETLEEAEREVKDLDASRPPEEGFQGDDWGPGAPKGFPPVP